LSLQGVFAVTITPSLRSRLSQDKPTLEMN
jgi:hypothetical protein